MTIWYTARGAGLGALIMLTLATATGALASVPVRAVGARVVVQYLHRGAAVMGLGLLVLHISAILADSYAGVGWLAALIPFTSDYRPGLTGISTIAAYLFLLVAATGAARGRMAHSPRATSLWRRVHVVSYLAWLLSALHGFTIGTDSNLSWVRWIYLGCGLAVGGALTIRLCFARRAPIRHTPIKRRLPAVQSAHPAAVAQRSPMKVEVSTR